MTASPARPGDAASLDLAALQAPVLVLGAASQVGRCLVERLAAAGVPAIAVGRGDAPAWATGVGWARADLHCDALPAGATVLGAGPLDALVAWLARENPPVRAVAALSSTSLHTKVDSTEPAERAIAQYLREAEGRLATWCAKHGVACTVLRPTLVYGRGLDANLTRAARLARRFRVLPVPGRAAGLRQPVHADDVAQALLAVATRPGTAVFDLPGGETLAYREMLERTLACLPVRARIVTVPKPLLRVALALARALPGYRDVSPAMLDRASRDLVFDGRAAREAFGWNPRPFRPEAGMFSSATDSP